MPAVDGLAMRDGTVLLTRISLCLGLGRSGFVLERNGLGGFSPLSILSDV
jgi:hypothetical protein